MKAKLLTLVLCFGMFVVAAPFALFADSEKGNVVINFDYTRQSGRATNQFAVWIEDTKGNVIKPLFITKFTGNGGWERRPDSLPDWVSSVGKNKNVDTMAGSTPQTGIMKYIWDCTDANGNPITAGTYIFFVEASLRWKNRAIFKGMIKLDGKSFTVQVSPKYFGDDIADRGMIQNVSATLVE